MVWLGTLFHQTKAEDDTGKFAERANMEITPEFLNNHTDLYQPFFDGRHTHKHAVYTAAFIDHIEKLLPKEFKGIKILTPEDFLKTRSVKG